MADSSDPHRNELVEIGREDRAELDPLEEREVGIRREREHPAVEIQPGQLSIEEPS
jgi:hypothetical protein